MNPIAWALLAMLVLTVTELAWVQWQTRQPAPWLEAVFNLNSGHALLWLFRGLELWAYAFLYEHYHYLDVQTLPIWAWAVLGFLAWDISFYVLHYCHHHSKWLWAIHVVHHTGAHFNLSLGIRNSWYSSLSSLPFFAWMAVVGFPPTVFLGVSILHYAIQLGNHNQIINHRTCLDRVFVTAYSHRVHHATAAIYRNKNFGSCLSIWDKLFGTYQTQHEHTPLQYATAFASSLNPYHANQWPWYAPQRRQRQQAPSVSPNLAWVVSAGLVLFLSVIFYVWYEYQWNVIQHLVWVGLFTAATIGLGHYSNGHGRGMWLLVLCLGLMALWVAYLQVWAWQALVCLLWVHNVYTLWTWPQTRLST